MKKVKKTRLTDLKLNKKLDELWSKVVRLKGYCEVCGKTTNLHAHHIFTRSKHATRWNLGNGVCLCFHHHFHFAHQSPMEFTDWLIETKSQEFIDNLRRKSNTIAKFSMEDKMYMLECLEEKYTAN